MIVTFIDTETTGLESPQIVQLAAISYDTERERIVAELNVLVKTTQLIKPSAMALHGIGSWLLRDAGITPQDADLMLDELLMISDRVVGHNLAFDLTAITNSEMIESRATLMLKPQEDTKDLPGGKHLDEAFRDMFGREMKNHHDAMADAHATMLIWLEHERRENAKGATS